MTDIIEKQFLFLFMGFSYSLISIHFKNKYTKQTNVCQRQGRCGLGCIPGARHTLNKQIYEAINRGKPLDVHPLCEVIDITETSNTEKDIDGYTYNVKFIDYRSVIDDPNLSSLKDLTDEEKEKLTKTIRTKMVIVSAGSLGYRNEFDDIGCPCRDMPRILSQLILSFSGDRSPLLCDSDYAPLGGYR